MEDVEKAFRAVLDMMDELNRRLNVLEEWMRMANVAIEGLVGVVESGV